MIFTSNLLGQLARACGLALPTPFETDVTVPASIQPVLVVPQNIAPASANPATTSASVSLQNDLTNGAAVQTGVLTLVKGFWEIDVMVSYVSNFVGTGNSLGYQLVLIDVTSLKLIQLAGIIPSGTATQINPVFINIQKRLVIDEAYTINTILGTNGAGQRHTHSTNIIVNRLL